MSNAGWRIRTISVQNQVLAIRCQSIQWDQLSSKVNTCYSRAAKPIKTAQIPWVPTWKTRGSCLQSMFQSMRTRGIIIISRKFMLSSKSKPIKWHLLRSNKEWITKSLLHFPKIRIISCMLMTWRKSSAVKIISTCSKVFSIRLLRAQIRVNLHQLSLKAKTLVDPSKIIKEASQILVRNRFVPPSPVSTSNKDL